MAQKMESVGRLAGGIAHDFNNMLSVIMGRIELLMLKVDKGHPFYNDFFQIRNAAERSANLTSHLLAFARRQVVVPRVIALNDSLKSLLRMMKRLIGENIKLNLDLDKNLWPVKIDPTQLDQVVANLTVNAKDAMSDKGVMDFTTKNVSIDGEIIDDLPGIIKGDYVLFTVSDNGCGMSQDILEKIFEPFFTTKKQGEGTGLGLSTIYGIVKQNNGYIYAFSEIGKGSEFRIYFPRCFDAIQKPMI
jgi:signal transduction histidine kinase